MKLLIVGDSNQEAEKIVSELKAGGLEPDWKRVEDEAGLRELLGSSGWDLVIYDHGAARFGVAGALEIVRGSGRDIPLIIVSDTVGEEAAVAAMKDGAHDYIAKNNLARLVPAVRREIYDAELRRQRNEIERELLESRAMLAAIHQSVPVSIVVLDSQFRVAVWNPAAETMFGWKEDEVVGQFIPAIPPEMIDDFRKLCRFPLQGHTRSAIELEMRRKDSSRSTCSVSIAPLPGEDNSVNHLVVVMMNITDRKHAEEALKIAHDELERKVEERTGELLKAKELADAANKAKSEFLACMSHELRTPLNAVIGFSDMLIAGYAGPLQEKQVEYIRDIVDSGRHLLSLMNDILDLSKVDAGCMDLEISKISIADLFTSARILVSERALKYNVTITVNLPDALQDLCIPADERKVKQIMYNLLSNAIKFTPEHGSITLAARLLSVDQTGALMAESGRGGTPSFLEVSVADTGIGIEPEHQAKIFDTFYQVKRGLVSKTPGTGLGLSLCRQLVELHGGKIWVESGGEGWGSRFLFTLPLNESMIPALQATNIMRGEGVL